MRISIGPVGGPDRPHYFGVRFILDPHEYAHICAGMKNTRVTVRGNVVEGIYLQGSDVGHYKLNQSGSPCFSTAASGLGFVEQKMGEQGVSTHLEQSRRVRLANIPVHLVSPKHRSKLVGYTPPTVHRPEPKSEPPQAAPIPAAVAAAAIYKSEESVTHKLPSKFAAKPGAQVQKPDVIRELIAAKDMYNLAIADFQKAIDAAIKAGHPIETFENDDGTVGIRTTTMQTVEL